MVQTEAGHQHRPGFQRTTARVVETEKPPNPFHRFRFLAETLDEIYRIGPSANYLGTTYTACTFGEEHYLTTLFDRRSWESWLKAGGRDISKEARVKAKCILAEHKVEPVEKGVQAKIDEFIKRTTKSYKI
jgi:trimethylamine:corrinoid methyltransferase-like protein